jgi:hypothetical protein
MDNYWSANTPGWDTARADESASWASSFVSDMDARASHLDSNVIQGSWTETATPGKAVAIFIVIAAVLILFAALTDKRK